MHCLVLKQESIVLTLIAAFLALLKWKNADAGFVYSKDEEFCTVSSAVCSHTLCPCILMASRLEKENLC